MKTLCRPPQIDRGGALGDSALNLLGLGRPQKVGDKWLGVPHKARQFGPTFGTMLKASCLVTIGVENLCALDYFTVDFDHHNSGDESIVSLFMPSSSWLSSQRSLLDR